MIDLRNGASDINALAKPNCEPLITFCQEFELTASVVPSLAIARQQIVIHPRDPLGESPMFARKSPPRPAY